MNANDENIAELNALVRLADNDIIFSCIKVVPIFSTTLKLYRILLLFLFRCTRLHVCFLSKKKLYIEIFFDPTSMRLMQLLVFRALAIIRSCNSWH